MPPFVRPQSTNPLANALKGAAGPPVANFPPLNQFGELEQQQLSPRAAQMQSLELGAARQDAETRFPFIRRFSDVKIAPTMVRNKGGMGEFVEPGNPANPRPGNFTITIGENSRNLQGGIADTIVADMVHAAGQFDPEFKKLKIELIQNLSQREIAFARKLYEEGRVNPRTGETEPPLKEKSGSNFATFENYLNSFVAEGMVQHLLIPENSEIEDIRRTSPGANETFNKIQRLFEGQ